MAEDKVFGKTISESDFKRFCEERGLFYHMADYGDMVHFYGTAAWRNVSRIRLLGGHFNTCTERPAKDSMPADKSRYGGCYNVYKDDIPRFVELVKLHEDDLASRKRRRIKRKRDDKEDKHLNEEAQAKCSKDKWERLPRESLALTIFWAEQEVAFKKFLVDHGVKPPAFDFPAEAPPGGICFGDYLRFSSLECDGTDRGGSCMLKVDSSHYELLVEYKEKFLDDCIAYFNSNPEDPPKFWVRLPNEKIPAEVEQERAKGTKIAERKFSDLLYYWSRFEDTN